MDGNSGPCIGVLARPVTRNRKSPWLLTVLTACDCGMLQQSLVLQIWNGTRLRLITHGAGVVFPMSLGQCDSGCSMDPESAKFSRVSCPSCANMMRCFSDMVTFVFSYPCSPSSSSIVVVTNLFFLHQIPFNCAVLCGHFTGKKCRYFLLFCAGFQLLGGGGFCQIHHFFSFSTSKERTAG